MPFIGNIGPGELLLLLVIILVIFGPGRLPEIGNAVGKGIREFRKAAADVTESTRLDAPPATPPAQPAAPAAQAASAAVPTAVAVPTAAAVPTASTAPSAPAGVPDEEAEARRKYEELKARFEPPVDQSHGDPGQPSA